MVKIGKSQQQFINNRPLITQAQEGTGFGHRFKVLAKEAKNHIVHVVAGVFSKRSPLGKVCKFTISVLTGVAHRVGPGFHGAGFLRAVSLVDGLLDVGDLFADVNGIVNREHHYEERNNQRKLIKSSLIANISFLVADVLGFVLWMDELAFISLSKLSATIGQGFSKIAAATTAAITKAIPSFAKVTTVLSKASPVLARVAAKVTLVNVLRFAVIGAFGALIANDTGKIIDAVRARDYQQIANSAIYIASYVAEIALKVMAIAACTNVIGLAVVGCLAAGLGLTGIVMEIVRAYRKEVAEEKAREERALQQQQQAVVPPVQQITLVEPLIAAA